MTQMMAPWSRVSFTVLDILLVAVIIYEVLAMIRGTRAAPMLAGLAAVAVAFYLARIGELVTLNWLVSHLAALRGVRADRGVSVGDSACVVGRRTASELSARVDGGGRLL